MKRLILSLVFLSPLVFAEQNTISINKGAKYKINFSDNPLTYTVTDDGIQSACDDAISTAQSQANSFIKTKKTQYPNYIFDTKLSECDRTNVAPGKYNSPQDIPKVFVSAFITYNDPTIVNRCTDLPTISGMYNNVYGTRTYINYNGCQYESSGVILCDNTGKICSADWKPTGLEADPDYGNSTIDDGSHDGNSNSGNSSGNNGGNNHGGGDTNNSGISDNKPLDEKQIARAVTTGIKDATLDLSKSISTDIKDNLTELDTSKNDQKYADDKTKSNIEILNDNIGDLVRGIGRYVDPDDNGTKYGEGVSSMDLAVSYASDYDISNSSHGYIWESFFNESSLRPKIPTGDGCSDFIIFSGMPYQIDIGCDKLRDIKSMLTWVMYCLTFWYAFTSLTSLLRKGE